MIAWIRINARRWNRIQIRWCVKPDPNSIARKMGPRIRITARLRNRSMVRWHIWTGRIRIDAGSRNRIQGRCDFTVPMDPDHRMVTEPDSGSIAFMGARAGYIRPPPSQAIGACHVVAMETGARALCVLLDDPLTA